MCEYVGERKETSKAASVLILRFFHSYFPSEIANILLTTRQAVEIWLLNARRESRLYLEDLGALKIIGSRLIGSSKSNVKNAVQLSQRLINSSGIARELCESILASRRGDCLTKDQLQDLYEGEDTIDCQRLAHIVSCSECLGMVNELLGLTSLMERYQMESPISDASDGSPPDSGGPSGTSGGSGASDKAGQRLRRRRRETIEHRPQELRIAVNGFFLSRQKVGLPVNELALKLNLEEKISFVEVFSEQGLLLSHFSVTPPTDGEIEQREEVKFGEGRALGTAVSFNTQWPTLHVVYRDPLVEHLQIAVIEEIQESEVRSHESEDVAADHRPLTPGPSVSTVTQHPTGDILLYWRKRLGRIFRAQFWLQPGTITAVFALLLLAGFLFVIRRPQPSLPITAVDLLQRATSAEETAAANTSTAIHRTLQIEERRGSVEGEVLARQRVEVWQSAARGVVARRLYDERGRLLSGEWTRSDNVSTLYHHGARPLLKPTGPMLAPLSLENIWQLSPSAKDFAVLIGPAQEMGLEEQGNHYVLSFESAAGSAPHRLVQAKLILSRDDLHAVEQTLQVQLENEVRAYRIIETSFERRPNEAVAPAVFEPEPELLSSIEPETRNSKLETVPPSPGPPIAVSPVLATAALEVEVLLALNQANAFMGEQLSVTRTSEGRLRVSGLVETAERKSELLRALAPVRNNPAVRVEIATVAEAVERERPEGPGDVTVERIETTEGTSPVYSDLKQKFSDDEARRFADRVMSRSRQARRHALALKQLAERFSIADLQTLSTTDRQLWVGLLQQHAREFEREIVALRRELQQVFPAPPEPGVVATGPRGPVLSEPGAVATGSYTDAEVQDAVRQLYQLSVTCDQDVRTSFALSAQSRRTAPVKSQQFWHTLSTAEGLSKRIASTH